VPGLVFAAIAPHGGLAIEEACAPGEERLALATRRGMQKLGRLLAAARPDTVIVATPHNVHISGALGVVVAARVAGRLGGAPPSVALDVPCDTELAWEILAAFGEAAIPAVGISFGGNDPSTAVAPMDWGVLIPLWFMGGRSDPPASLVVVTPARDLSAETHIRAGAAIARAAASSGRRVAFIASADHGHAHVADGPYGFDPGAKEYDDLIRELVTRDELQRLAEIPLELVERAKADSWWQMLILRGAVGDGWRGRLISYEAPTYFGMLTAAYAPTSQRRTSRGTSSPPRTHSRRRTPAR
jgi:aromatic ring-opening dioxygenase LigB subunit